MTGEINQVVICINDSHCAPPIKKGFKYVINDIHLCPTCGTIEFKLSIPSNSLLSCATCDTSWPDELCDSWWAENWRFAPLETKKEEKSNLNIKLEPKKILKELDLISN